jgi:hypothetical protein
MKVVTCIWGLGHVVRVVLMHILCTCASMTPHAMW